MGKRAGVGGIAVRPPVIATEATHGRERETAPLLSAPSRSGLGLAASRLFLGVLPLALLVLLVVARYLTGKRLGFDYKPLWEASRHVLDGASPYPRPEAWALHDEQQFVYPPLAAFLFAPLAAFPFAVAAPLLAVVELAATGLTLRVLGVRDWRCYGVVLLWYPVLQNFLLGSITSVLALGLAVAWRYRDSRSIAPVALAALIAAKIFLWPLLVWVGASHRWRRLRSARGSGRTRRAPDLPRPASSPAESSLRESESFPALLSPLEGFCLCSLVYAVEEARCTRERLGSPTPSAEKAATTRRISARVR